ncbi:MAG TPA: hypothetical protein VN213_21155 [Solirubrobacteraceae bacterium]|nr:hypothetical protein [Solirubrobacteraceae bacterium]
MRILMTAVAMTAALALASCGGDEPAPADKPPADVEDELGFDQASIMERQSRVETAIQACMRNQGFEYTPVDPFAQRAAVVGSSRLTDEEFLRQYGYGISTLWGRGRAQSDPNAEIRLALGPADRKAYDRALWGDNPGATFTDAVENGNFTRLGGCTREATEQVFGGARVLTQLQARLDQLEERILQDQRMVRAIEDWSGCMQQAGFEYEDPEAIDTDLFTRMERLVGPLPGQFATGPAPGEKPKSFPPSALTQLQRDEVSIARADHACELKHITPVEDAVAPQYAEDFRQSNRALMAQVKPAR